jgi:galactose mutarotase-like enzyme
MAETPIVLQVPGARAVVAPWRGGIVSEFEIGGEPILHADHASLHDPTKSVRGGNPILFPFCGSLEGNIFKPAGTTIPQHGFARSRSWNVDFQGASELHLSLAADADNLAVYPWDFLLRQRIVLSDKALAITLLVENRSTTPMPVAPGWHPYFPWPGKYQDHVKVIGAADFDGSALSTPNRAFDQGVVLPRQGFPMRHVRFVASGKQYDLAFSTNFEWLQFWSLHDREFICVEPFAGPPHRINSPEAINVPPRGWEVFDLHIGRWE